MATVSDLFVRINADNRGLLSGLTASSSAVRSFAAQAKTGFVVAGIAVGVASAKMAIDFQASMQKIVALVGVSQTQVDAWSQDILDLSTTIPEAPKAFADAMFYVTSAGFRGAEAMDILKISAMASASGLGEMKTVADVVTSAMNAYADSGLTAADATDILISAVTQGKFAPEDLAQNLGQVLPVAELVGVSLDQVAAAIASVSRQGLSVPRATTALRFLLGSFIKPSAQAVAALGQIGMTSQDLQDSLAQRGLLDTLVTLANKFDITTAAGRKMFATILGGSRGSYVALALVGDKLDANRKIFQNTANAAGETMRAFAVASKTAQFQIKLLGTTVQSLGIRLGQLLLPFVAAAFGDIVFALKPLVFLMGLLVKAVTPLQPALVLLFRTFVAYKILSFLPTLLGWIGGGFTKLTGSLIGTTVATDAQAASTEIQAAAVADDAAAITGLAGVLSTRLVPALEAIITLNGGVVASAEAATLAEAGIASAAVAGSLRFPMGFSSTVAQGRTVGAAASGLRAFAAALPKLAMIAGVIVLITGLTDAWSAEKTATEEANAALARIRQGLATTSPQIQATLQNMADAANKARLNFAHLGDWPKIIGEGLLKLGGQQTSAERWAAAIAKAEDLVAKHAEYVRRTVVDMLGITEGFRTIPAFIGPTSVTEQRALSQELERTTHNFGALTSAIINQTDVADTVKFRLASLIGTYIRLTGSVRGLRLPMLTAAVQSGDTAKALNLVKQASADAGIGFQRLAQAAARTHPSLAALGAGLDDLGDAATLPMENLTALEQLLIPVGAGLQEFGRVSGIAADGIVSDFLKVATSTKSSLSDIIQAGAQAVVQAKAVWQQWHDAIVENFGGAASALSKFADVTHVELWRATRELDRYTAHIERFGSNIATIQEKFGHRADEFVNWAQQQGIAQEGLVARLAHANNKSANDFISSWNRAGAATDTLATQIQKALDPAFHHIIVGLKNIVRVLQGLPPLKVKDEATPVLDDVNTDLIALSAKNKWEVILNADTSKATSALDALMAQLNAIARQWHVDLLVQREFTGSGTPAPPPIDKNSRIVVPVSEEVSAYVSGMSRVGTPEQQMKVKLEVDRRRFGRDLDWDLLASGR